MLNYTKNRGRSQRGGVILVVKDTLGLIFRPAASVDVEEIWDILHAQSIPWSVGKIQSQIDRFFLLLQNQSILGVMWEPVQGELGCEWVVIHPFYPEQPLRDLIIESRRSLHLVYELNSQRPSSLRQVPVF